MSRLHRAPSPRTGRPGALSTIEQVRAVFSHEPLYRLAQLIPERSPVGRPAHHPGYLLLGYGVLARLFRSGIRVQTELNDQAVWCAVVETVTAMQRTHPDLVPRLPGRKPPNWDAFRHARNRHLTDPEVLTELQQLFTVTAVEQAHNLGLLNRNGPGSLSHPDPTRVVYGDGTVVRPLYRPPTATRTTDPSDPTGPTTVTYRDRQGRPTKAPTRRFDPDAADYHGHTGPVHGQNFVALYARGDAPHQRVVLAVDRVPRPGQEADTAVRAITRLHQVAGSGIQAVVYDGAMRGVHIDELMTSLGLVVVNKVHASAKTAARRGKTTTPRWYPPRHLGTRHPHRRLYPPARRRRRSGQRDQPGRQKRTRRPAPPRTPTGQTTPTGLRPLPLQRRLRSALPHRLLPGLGHTARPARRP